MDAAEKTISKEVADVAYQEALCTQADVNSVSIKHSVNPESYFWVVNEWIK